MDANDAALIVTLKVKLDTRWSADIEFHGVDSLYNVHLAIQRAVNFDDDHLWDFFSARDPWTRNRTMYDEDTRICDVFPQPPKKQLFYLFDYGDSWYFKILKSQKRLHAPRPNAKYPRVVAKTGRRPKQYDQDWFS